MNQINCLHISLTSFTEEEDVIDILRTDSSEMPAHRGML